MLQTLRFQRIILYYLSRTATRNGRAVSESSQCCPFRGIFDCFDSENQWDGIVVFVGY